MIDYILETNNLRKNIKHHDIIKGITLKIPSGITYGLLGPNGAGKSTFIKLIVGLMKSNDGEIIFNHQPLSRSTLQQIGVLIEHPALYGNLTAYENMLVHAEMLNVSRNKIDETLCLLKMNNTGNKRVSQFSLGMKQRLGIAIALLGDPKFVVLDEPTNGLDPLGIQELRMLIHHLNQQGITILISSHNLAEIQQIASHIGIIVNGELKYEGSVNDSINLETIYMSVTSEAGDIYG